MKFKIRPKPPKLFLNQALLGRLPLLYPKIPLIEDSIRRLEAGYIGEQRLDSLLEQHSPKDYHIHKGFYLPSSKNDSHFQIDTTLVKPTHIPTFEVKNMTGEIIIDRKAGQMIQKYQNTEKVYEDPLLQAELQAWHFRKWMDCHGFPNIPVEPLVMMSNYNCLLRIENDPSAQYRICRGRQILYRIEDFEKKYKTEILTPAMIRKLNRLIAKESFEPRYDFEKLYKIPKRDILPGVHCPSCQFLGMKYYHGSWVCPNCGMKSRDAHLAALRDYYLLFGPEITNRQFREFIGLKSGDIANKMLKKLNLHSTGKNKNVVYHLKWELFSIL